MRLFWLALIKTRLTNCRCLIIRLPKFRRILIWVLSTDNDVSMRHFKIYLSDTRGDEFDFWGGTSFYLEVDETWYAKRQIESYDNGVILTYDENHPSDIYGMLSDRPLI